MIRIVGRWRPNYPCGKTISTTREPTSQAVLNVGSKRTQPGLRDLIAQLKAAEREGRVEDARMLNTQVNELRMQKAGRPSTGMLSLVKE